MIFLDNMMRINKYLKKVGTKNIIPLDTSTVVSHSIYERSEEERGRRGGLKNGTEHAYSLFFFLAKYSFASCILGTFY